MTMIGFTVRDLERLPEIEGWRYEIIDGELFVSTQPHNDHQETWALTTTALGTWNTMTGTGRIFGAPGIVFADDDAVAPDLVWVSRARYPRVTTQEGKFHSAPELVIEILSPGRANERRDREIKLALYDRRGVEEYWLMDWERRLIEVYRRADTGLRLATTITDIDTLTTPLLPGFSVAVSSLFPPLEG